MKTKDALHLEAKHPISESVRKRNPHLYPDLLEPNMEKFVEQLAAAHPPPPKRQSKRIRQSSKPLMNKLETEFYQQLIDRDKSHSENWYHLRIQSKKFKIGNGVYYCPDFTAIVTKRDEDWGPTEYAFEVKGFMRDDAAVKIKVAATTYPEISWFLVWKENGVWREQEVKP